MQVWLQDLIITVVGYGALLTLSGHVRTMNVALICAVRIAIGFLAAEEITAGMRWGARPISRALFFAGILLLAGACPWLLLMGWYVFRLFSSQVTCYPDFGAPRNGLLAATIVLGVYAIAFFLPVEPGCGFLAYLFSFGEAIGDTLRGLNSSSVHGKAWQANPALWLSVSFLMSGSWLRAAIFGGIALEFGVTASDEVGHGEYGYYIWMGSMALVVVFSLAGLAARAVQSFRKRIAITPSDAQSEAVL